MKDKYGGKLTEKFIGLKFKMYSILDEKIMKRVQIKEAML